MAHGQRLTGAHRPKCIASNSSISTQWKRPRTGGYKLNIDAALWMLELVGAIIRNEHGQVTGP